MSVDLNQSIDPVIPDILPLFDSAAFTESDIPLGIRNVAEAIPGAT